MNRGVLNFAPLCSGVVLCLVFLLVSAERAQPSAAQGIWSSKAAMPIKASEVTVGTAAGKLYAIGGATPEIEALRTNYEYDPASDRWRERANLPRGLTHASTVGLNGKIYVVGAFTTGGHGAATDQVFEYDPAADSWRSLAPLKSPRGSVGVTALDGKIHAIGGRGVDKVTVTTHEVYDPATNQWTERAGLPKARDHLAVVAANGKIYAVGGRLDASTQNTDFTDIYDPAKNTWQSGTPMPTARSGVAGAFYKNLVIVAGGECRDRKTYPEVEGYDVKTGRWSKLASLPAGRHGFGGAVVGGALYFAGGAVECGGGQRTNELLVFTLP
jgi:N-acetylneuraminic acid mutarotase